MNEMYSCNCWQYTNPFSIEIGRFSTLTTYFSLQDFSFPITGVSDGDFPENNTIIFCKRKFVPSEFSRIANSIVVARDALAIKNQHDWEKTDLAGDDFKRIFSELLLEYEIHRPCLKPIVHETARLGKNCFVGANVVIGENVKIGSNCVIENNTTINANVTIGDGCVIGNEDADCYLDKKGNQNTVPHTKGVLIGNGSVVMAGAMIAGGSTIQTQIGMRCIIGERAVIAHNTRIYDDSKIMAGAVIGGYCVLERQTYVGIGALIKNRLTIGEGSFIGMGSVVTKSVKAGRRVFGNPARRIDFDNDRL